MSAPFRRVVDCVDGHVVIEEVRLDRGRESRIQFAVWPSRISAAEARLIAAALLNAAAAIDGQEPDGRAVQP